MSDTQVQWFERHRYFEADEECAEYFTSSVGVKAQSYEPHGGNTVDISNTLPGQRYIGEAKRWDTIRTTLATVDQQQREVLRLVYEPHSWETWLASALAPRFGRGSFVLLATTTPRALAAWRKAFPTDPRPPTPEVVLTWVLGMGRALDVAKRLATWVPDCEAARTKALHAYDTVLRVRQKATAQAKALRAAAAAAQGASIREQGRIAREEREATRFRERMARARLGAA